LLIVLLDVVDDNPAQRFVIQMLNQLAGATPEVVIGSTVPVAISIIVRNSSERSLAASNSRLTPLMCCRSNVEAHQHQPRSAAHRRNGELFLVLLFILDPPACVQQAALHFLDAYMKQCVATDQLANAWNSLAVRATLKIRRG
jgi:hypothetical protein